MALAYLLIAMLASKFAQQPINSKYLLVQLEEDILNAEENEEGKNEAPMPVPELGEGVSAGRTGTSICT